MSGILKFVIRLGVIGVLLFVGAIFVFGADRIEAVADQVRGNVQDLIDNQVDDPVALRRQLSKLEREYPKRIAQVRSDLGQLHQQMRQLEQQKAVADRVVVLAENDLKEIDGKLENGARLTSTGAGDEWYFERLERRAAQVRQTRAAYASRAADSEHDLGYLRQQGERLQELLGRLENEYTRFQSQLQQLDRQVDAVERNDRLIELIKKRQQTIEELGRYEANSLDQLRGRLGEILSRQEAELEVLVEGTAREEYEVRAMESLGPEREVIEVCPLPTGR